jgi:peroxiredoxin
MKTITLLSLSFMAAGSLQAEPWAIAKIGDRPYAFAAKATDGSPVALPESGKVALVYLFSTQAGAGMQELKMINKYVWPKFKSSGLVLIGVAREAQTDELKIVARDLGIDFPLVADPQKAIFLHYATRGHPRAYLVGKDGTIKLVSLGYTDDEVDRISDAVAAELEK